MKSRNLFYGILVLILMILVIVAHDTSVYTKLFYALAACAGVWVVRTDMARNRHKNRALSTLSVREDTDLLREYRGIQRSSSIPLEDITRLWGAMASFVGLPPQKIRAHDRLDQELSPFIRDPDHDLASAPLLQLHQSLAHEALADVHTWGDLIVAVWQFEVKVGTPATKKIDRDGISVHEWID